MPIANIKTYLISLFVALVCGTTLCAQDSFVPEQPNFAEIAQEINDPLSPYYYPTLTHKYYSNDTTMTIEEYRYFYLGYSFQEDYNPYRVSEYAHQIDHLYKQNKQLSVAEKENLVKFAKQTLNDDPFDLRQINILIYGLKSTNKHQEAAIWQYRLDHLLDAILSTGDGMSPETAWHVIYPSHEYIILNCLGMKGIDFVFVEPIYDYVEIEKNTRQIEGFYFNVERILDIYNLKYCYNESCE